LTGTFLRDMSSLTLLKTPGPLEFFVIPSAR